MPLQRRTRLAKAIELERKKSVTNTPPPTQAKMVELSSLEDKVQQWVNEQRELGDDVLSIPDFDFMPMGTELDGDKIRDTPIGEFQQQDWMQMPPETQGPHPTPPSSPQVMMVDKVLVTPPPPSSEEHV